MNFINGKTLGILGSGQLAKMLTHSAQKMGLKVSIYSNSLTDQASTIADHHTKGLLTESEKLKNWIKSCDKVTFESEFSEIKNIKSSKIAPSIKNMNLLKDRLSQKNALKSSKVPTSPFSIASKELTFTKPLVFKKRLFGYDGYGTVVCKSPTNLSKFLKKTSDLNNWIVEDFIPFKRELAFSISRDDKNNFCQLPLVETFQKDSKCFWVKGPLKHSKISPMVSKVKKLLTNLDYVGVIAVELFETKSGELIVNELAPRVHNSGHHSIESSHLSQFDVHILSLFNQSLPKLIKPHSDFAMVNLIGTKKSAPKLQNPINGSLHWYGKLDNRPGRKMGHLTVLDKTAVKALKLALTEEKRQNL